jgi:predicted DNA-binding ribbon-helix-helix protein
MRLDSRGKRPMIRSLVVTQSVNIKGRHSSVSLESAFWNALKEIAATQKITAAALVSKIDSKREAANLSSAIRVHVLEHYLSRTRAPATRMISDGET